MRIMATDGRSSGFTGLYTDLYIKTIALTIVNKVDISFFILVLMLDLCGLFKYLGAYNINQYYTQLY